MPPTGEVRPGGGHITAIVGWIVVMVAFLGVIVWERKSPVIAHEDHVPV